MAVVDANVAVALIVDLPWSSEARELIRQDEMPIAPAIFRAEIANVLW
jgi:predicted nucleic acid-binding protein